MRKKPFFDALNGHLPGGQGLTQIGTLRIGSAPGFTSENCRYEKLSPFERKPKP